MFYLTHISRSTIKVNEYTRKILLPFYKRRQLLQKGAESLYLKLFKNIGYSRKEYAPRENNVFALKNDHK